jgi:hypothetical protein
MQLETTMKQNDMPIEYIKRTREYYLALGYGAPYEWAQFAEVPFCKLAKPLNECTVAVVTTAARFQADKGDQSPGAPYNAAAKFYEVYACSSADQPDLRISHIAIDRDHTTAEDLGTYFPLEALQLAHEEGRVGQVGGRFYGLPTNRSVRTTTDVDGPSLLTMCKEDGVDAVVLVPNCPVCHQSVSIAARILEEGGIATVVMGAAKDIVEHVGVPRFVFSDFPLGNSAGRPNDLESQQTTLGLALDMLAEADDARTTKQSPLAWLGAPDWKDDYSNAAKLSAEEIAERKAAFDAGKNTAKQVLKGKVP